MHRFYLPQPLTNTLVITEEKLWRELTLVKRARIGDQIAFFDGNVDEDSLYTIEKIDKKSVTLKKTGTQKNAGKLSTTTLCQALPNKLDKLELIVQKTTELGIGKIVIFSSERSNQLVISENKLERLRAIAIEAVEQSGGGEIPEIILTDKLPSLTSAIVLHTDTTLPKGSLQNAQNIIIGPEGGFSPREIEKFQEMNFECFNLGERVLRTETAAIVAIAMTLMW